MAKNKYTVTYDSNTGTNLSKTSDSVYYGDNIDLTPTATKEGYTFIGWNTDRNAKEGLKTLKIGSSDQTLYAIFVKTTYEFDYTGSEQVFTVPVSGIYKIETWGASGGYVYSKDYLGGYGGYSNGKINLQNKEKLYIYIGGSGEDNCVEKSCLGGYNGGGSTGYVFDTNSVWNGASGGATHIASQSGLLSTLSNSISSIYMVSGGGGGATYHNNTSTFGFKHFGGSAGGYIGSGNCSESADILSSSGCGGNQKSTGNVSSDEYGTKGGFGFGASQTCDGSNWPNDYSLRKCYVPGGGAGLYGGSTGPHGVADGGSSYIGNPLLTDKAMYCYNCEESSEESTKTIITTCASSTPTEKCAKEGNGYAKITLISID